MKYLMGDCRLLVIFIAGINWKELTYFENCRWQVKNLYIIEKLVEENIF